MNALKDITWQEYLGTMAILTLIYYVVVIMLFYRSRIRQLMKGRHAVHTEKVEAEDTDDMLSDADHEMMGELEVIVDDLRHSILVPGTETTKAELLAQLQQRVANYGGLRRPGYRHALNNFIITQAKEHCRADFSEEELDHAWGIGKG